MTDSTPRPPRTNEAAEQLRHAMGEAKDHIALLDAALAFERAEAAAPDAGLREAAWDVVNQEGRYLPSKNTDAIAETFKSLVVVPKAALDRLRVALAAHRSSDPSPDTFRDFERTVLQYTDPKDAGHVLNAIAGLRFKVGSDDPE